LIHSFFYNQLVLRSKTTFRFIRDDSDGLARIAAKSPEFEKLIFSRPKRATLEAPFWALEKLLFN